MSEIVELYSESISNFKSHIEDDENHRTIFNGRFGSGKTMFLKYFISKQESIFGENKYYPIHIFPVNYSISSNEDIIKFIKYDIITHLLLNNGIKVSDSIDLKTISGRFIIKNIDRIIASLFLFIPTWGGQAKEAFDILKGLINEFKEFEKSEQDEVADFINRVELDVKSAYEDDFISSLIQKACLNLKSEGKQVVVIIDDLDRIDPDHIFRILNVFASHFDFQNMLEIPNKYGFDKLILVGDIQNIRNIFRAKFGGETDFNGYIDKFYSKNIFNFDNRKLVKQYSRNIIKEIKFEGSNSAILIYYENILQRSPRFPAIEFLINNNIIALRQLFKFYKKSYSVSNEKTVIINGYRYYENFCLSAVYLRFISRLFSSSFDFIEKVKSSSFIIQKQDSEIIQFYEELTLLYFLTHENYNNQIKEGSVIFENNLSKINFSLQIKFNASFIDLSNVQTTWRGSGNTLNFIELPFKEVFLGAIEGLNNSGFFEDN